MSNSSLGFSFIESTEKIKGKLKQKTKEVKKKAPMPKAPVAPVIEQFDVHNEMSGSDDENDENGQDVPDEQDQPDDEQDTPNDETPLEDHNISYTLIPHAGTPGSTFVTSITVDEGQEIDWLSIEQITAFGNLTICDHQPLYDRILLTIQIPEDAQEAPVDFLVQYTDGDVDLIEDAFYIDEEFDLSSALVSPDECSE